MGQTAYIRGRYQENVAASRTVGRALVYGSIIAMVGAGVGAALGGESPGIGAVLGGGGILIMAASVVALADWRRGFLLLALIVLAEDSVRKALPGAPGWVNLGKDFVVASCYLGYFFSPRKFEPRERLPAKVRGLMLLPIFLWYGFVVIQAFNPGVSHFLLGISGIRTWVLYMPVLWIAASYFRDSETAQKSLNWVCALALPFLGLCLLQNNFSEVLPAAFKEGVFKRERSLEGGGWIGYNESFFASPTLYALICLFQFCLVVGLLKTQQTTRWTVILWASGYAAVAGAYLSGVRTALSLMAIAVATLTPLMLMRSYVEPDGQVTRRRGLFLGGLVGLLLGALLVASMGELRQRAFWTAFNSDYVDDRVTASVRVIDDFHGGLLGNGTGTAGASGRVMSLVGLPNPSVEKAEWGTTVISYCFGTVGLWLGIILVSWFLLGTLRMATEYRNGRFAPLRYSLWVFMGAQLSWYLFKAFPVLENGTMCLVFWVSAGLILGLHRLDQRDFMQAGLRG